jgi:hypothetical protein
MADVVKGVSKGAGAFVQGLAQASLNIVAAATFGLLLKPGKAKPTADGVKQAFTQATSPRRIVYGQRILSGPIVFMETNGNENSNLHMVIALTTHPVEDITHCIINDEVIRISGYPQTSSTSGGGASGYNAGKSVGAFVGNDLVTRSYHVYEDSVGGAGINDPMVPEVAEKWGHTYELVENNEMQKASLQIIKVNGWATANSTYMPNTPTDLWYNRDVSAQKQISANIAHYAGTRDVGSAPAEQSTTPGAASPQDNKWINTANKLTNCSYVYLRIRFDRKRPWRTAIPQVRFLVKGKRVYDPTDDTQSDHTNLGRNGGNPNTSPLHRWGINEGLDGTQRFDDPATYKWTTNWAACVLDYLLDTQYGLAARTNGGAAVYSSGEQFDEIDWASFAQAIRDCDTKVPRGDTGGPASVVRYSVNTVIETDRTPIDIVEELLNEGAGYLIYANGQYSLKAGIYTKPANANDILTDKDLADENIVITTSVDRGSLFNRVTGTYTRAFQPSPSPNGYETYTGLDGYPSYETHDFPEVNPQLSGGGGNPYENQDGEPIIEEFAFPGTTNEYEAQRIARLYLERNRQSLTVEAKFKLNSIEYIVGDVIYLAPSADTNPPESPFYRLGWTTDVQNDPLDTNYSGLGPKQFLITEMTLNEDYTVNVVLQEETSFIYDWNDGDAFEDDIAPNTALDLAKLTELPAPPTWDVTQSASIPPIESLIVSNPDTQIVTRLRWERDFTTLVTANELEGAPIANYELEYGIMTDSQNSDPSLRVAEYIAWGEIPHVDDEDVLTIETQGPVDIFGLDNSSISTDPVFPSPIDNGDIVRYDFRIRSISVYDVPSAWIYFSDSTFAPSDGFGYLVDKDLVPPPQPDGLEVIPTLNTGFMNIAVDLTSNNEVDMSHIRIITSKVINDPFDTATTNELIILTPKNLLTATIKNFTTIWAPPDNDTWYFWAHAVDISGNESVPFPNYESPDFADGIGAAITGVPLLICDPFFANTVDANTGFWAVADSSWPALPKEPAIVWDSTGINFYSPSDLNPGQRVLEITGDGTNKLVISKCSPTIVAIPGDAVKVVVRFRVTDSVTPGTGDILEVFASLKGDGFPPDNPSPIPDLQGNWLKKASAFIHLAEYDGTKGGALNEWHTWTATGIIGADRTPNELNRYAIGVRARTSFNGATVEIDSIKAENTSLPVEFENDAELIRDPFFDNIDASGNPTDWVISSNASIVEDVGEDGGNVLQFSAPYNGALAIANPGKRRRMVFGQVVEYTARVKIDSGGSITKPKDEANMFFGLIMTDQDDVTQFDDTTIRDGIVKLNKFPTDIWFSYSGKLFVENISGLNTLNHANFQLGVTTDVNTDIQIDSIRAKIAEIKFPLSEEEIIAFDSEADNIVKNTEFPVATVDRYGAKPDAELAGTWDGSSVLLETALTAVDTTLGYSAVLDNGDYFFSGDSNNNFTVTLANPLKIERNARLIIAAGSTVNVPNIISDIEIQSIVLEDNTSSLNITNAQDLSPDMFGTGATNLQNAIDSGAPGSTIRLFEKKYTVDPLTITTDHTASPGLEGPLSLAIRGTGSPGTRLQDGKGGSTIELANGSNDHLFTITGSSIGGGAFSRVGLLMEDVKLDGNKANQSGSTHDVINIASGEDFFFDRVYIENAAQDGFNTNTNLVTNVNIGYMEITGCNNNGFRDTDMMEYTVNTIKSYNNGNMGFFLQGEEGTISSLIAESNGADGVRITGKGNQISSIIAKNNQNNGVIFTGTSPDNAEDNVVLNILAFDNGQADGGVGTAEGIAFTTHAENNTIVKAVPSGGQLAGSGIVQQRSGIYIATTTDDTENKVLNVDYDGPGHEDVAVWVDSGSRAHNNSIGQATYTQPTVTLGTPDSFSVNPYKGQIHDVTLVGDTNVNQINANFHINGMTVTFIFRQDSTGGHTLTWGTGWNDFGWQPDAAASTVSTVTFLSIDGEMYITSADSGTLSASADEIITGTWTFQNGLILPNTVALKAENANSPVVANDILSMTANDVVRLGNVGFPIIMRAIDHDISVWDGTTTYDIWHAGNLYEQLDTAEGALVVRPQFPIGDLRRYTTNNGDGTTDVSGAMQNMLDSGAKYCFIPTPEIAWRIDTGLTWVAGTNDGVYVHCSKGTQIDYYGTGWAFTFTDLKNQNGAGIFGFSLWLQNNGNGIYLQQSSGCSFDDFEINGINDFGTGIYFEGQVGGSPEQACVFNRLGDQYLIRNMDIGIDMDTIGADDTAWANRNYLGFGQVNGGNIGVRMRRANTNAIYTRTAGVDERGFVIKHHVAKNIFFMYNENNSPAFEIAWQGENGVGEEASTTTQNMIMGNAQEADFYIGSYNDGDGAKNYGIPWHTNQIFTGQGFHRYSFPSVREGFTLRSKGNDGFSVTPSDDNSPTGWNTSTGYFFKTLDALGGTPVTVLEISGPGAAVKHAAIHTQLRLVGNDDSAITGEKIIVAEPWTTSSPALVDVIGLNTSDVIVIGDTELAQISLRAANHDVIVFDGADSYPVLHTNNFQTELEATGFTPTLNGLWTFNDRIDGIAIRLEDAVPAIQLRDTDVVAPDESRFKITFNNGDLIFRTALDSPVYDDGRVALRINRGTGQVISDIQIGNGTDNPIINAIGELQESGNRVVTSSPPSGHVRVDNIYVDPSTGLVKVDWTT